MTRNYDKTMKHIVYIMWIVM